MSEQEGGVGNGDLPLQQQQDDAVATGGHVIQNRRAAAPDRPIMLTSKTPKEGEISWSQIEEYLTLFDGELDAGKGSNIARRIYDHYKRPGENEDVPAYKDLQPSVQNRLRGNIKFFVAKL
jgi:hypothetical protein